MYYIFLVDVIHVIELLLSVYNYFPALPCQGLAA